MAFRYPHGLMEYQFRQYQVDIRREVQAGFQSGFRSLLIQLATGGGKTVIAGDFALRLYHQAQKRKYKGCIALYLVHREELMAQTLNTLHNFGLGGLTGVIASGQTMSPNAPFQLASIQTLVRRLEKLRWLNPRLLFIDECHHIRANTWEKVINFYPKAYRLGLTATPARLDGQGLAPYFEHLIIGPSIPSLIEQGHLCKVKTFTIPIKVDLSKARKSKATGDYTAESLRKLMPKGPVVADTVRNFEKYVRNRRVLNFSYSVETSRDSVSKIRALGVRAEHVDAETHPIARRRAFQQFETGEIQLLSNVEIATEGYDCVECDAVILSRPTASVVLYKQMVGRVFRPKHDGRDGMIIDGAGNVDIHGDPDAEIEWSLDQGVVLESAEKAKKAGRTCTNCGFRFKGDQCPACGEQWVGRLADEVEVELEERPSKKPKAPTALRQQVMERVKNSGGDKKILLDCARILNYNPRVIHVWHDLYKWKWTKQGKQSQEDPKDVFTF